MDRTSRPSPTPKPSNPQPSTVVSCLIMTKWANVIPYRIQVHISRKDNCVVLVSVGTFRPVGGKVSGTW